MCRIYTGIERNHDLTFLYFSVEKVVNFFLPRVCRVFVFIVAQVKRVVLVRLVSRVSRDG